MHKINKDQAIALTKLATSLQPGWDAKDFMSELARHREQDDFPRFVGRIVEGALMGEAIDDAMKLPPAHACPVVETRDEAWLNAVVNENDPSASRLLAKPKLDTPAAKPPNEDPNNWRNRFARDIEAGRQQRQSDLMKNRAAEPLGSPVVTKALNDFADSFAPPQHHDDQGYYPESAPAPAAEWQSVPTHDVVEPAAEVPPAPATRFTAMTQPTESDEERKAREDAAHRKMLLAAAKKREQQQNGYSGRNAGWNDHNPDK
ncbi:hypothetical protein SEA_TIMINATOR_40 [Arthrobacter phage Timinator]|uniref:Uncharacterized protein n=2 Tax=Marthavirus barretlemon TaxID=2560300 RepID=A0A386KPZ4_9CAUD|nr:hypothetical protein SEA_TIMINATOR_40 [Arthrobacter phage Timinator]AYD86511.1 hypothetical protein SEA_LEEROYJ_40 [Arthrobacter phage LeeroyJ]